ncbi:hypothetical protein [Clostridium oryzae]|uniref:N-acetyltransferase domain-containing protein n=1 Tax=Clostridium oryzae TaxID=1450648 RepID=A0A1V4IF48_9CLOT|nr:hypothetical protein [Clostridium oryzae]OPJ58265.1 hypothetical protein CLORY_36850 [Clostridium oryzae]
MVIENIYINNEKVEIKLCSFEEIKNLQQIILASIGSKEIFEAADESASTEGRQYKEYIYGVFLKKVLAAYFIVVIPGSDKCNLGLEIGISGDELLKVIHYDTVAVSPEFRGNNLQEQIGKLIESKAKNLGFKYICATVSPMNKYSLSNVIKLGYSIKKEKKMYGNKDRYIVCKRIL